MFFWFFRVLLSSPIRNLQSDTLPISVQISHPTQRPNERNMTTNHTHTHTHTERTEVGKPFRTCIFSVSLSPLSPSRCMIRDGASRSSSLLSVTVTRICICTCRHLFVLLILFLASWSLSQFVLDHIIPLPYRIQSVHWSSSHAMTESNGEVKELLSRIADVDMYQYRYFALHASLEMCVEEQNPSRNDCVQRIVFNVPRTRRNIYHGC